MPTVVYRDIPKETNITDEDIKYLFKEVQKINKDWRIVEEKKIIKKLFRKPVEKKLYQLYLDIGKGVHQVFYLNDVNDEIISLFAPCDKKTIMAWLLGFIHGSSDKA